MKTDTPKTIYLKDYTPYPYDVLGIDLDFDIRPGLTTVRAVTHFRRKKKEPLVLNGEELVLKSIKLDGAELKPGEYAVSDTHLTIPAPANEQFILEIITAIEPEKNTRLEGLYMSGGNYCTQCEAEGFRRITYYPDRPDVMTTFNVRLEADEKSYPVLLSNGNLTDKGKAKDGRHYAVWKDPHPKPCYLFALVAGNLCEVPDTFTTKSGRKVDLYIYVRHGDEGQCAHAMESLKKSMKWDEDIYGLEYDLDIFNIVAVSDFNMGAMENKSLNIFNTALVLAQQDTATDGDYGRVESVIAHEYFHNWSGNRVTCRDWFQLSLKEGLTVFRDQEFSSDLNSRAVQRIDDVTHLRRSQFPEDAGPLAHPIRPENYIEINNFYTMTVYEKGAEVIRMMRTLMGPETYRKATDLYFQRHDGHAATCDDFVKCMEDASGIDLTHFRLWYEQAGTPEVSFKGKYDAAKKTYTLDFSQNVPPTPGQPKKKPMHIPVLAGLVGANGSDIDLGGGETSMLLNLEKEKQSFTFENIPSEPVPSVLRGFSAPVKLKSDLSDANLAFLMVHDSDGFNRWEAGQTYFLRTLNRMIDEKIAVPDDFLQNYSDLLDRAIDPRSDKALMARAISLPDIPIIALGRRPIDPQAIHEAREAALNTIIDNFAGKLDEICAQNAPEKKFSITAEAMGCRALHNTTFLIRSNKLTADDAKRAKEFYSSATNMTDRMAALFLGCALDGPAHDEIVGDFYERFKSHLLVIDKWFSAQAQIHLPKTMDVVKKLRAHPNFNIRNPNRVRSLYGAFAMSNPVRFHAADGSGYKFLTDAVIELNTINPQIAARLLTPMRDWKNYTQDRQEKLKASLQKILEQPKLSPDVFEIADKSFKA
ncbi:MAG: aminopeptidase N [Alphaproteobacteria bacterium]